MLNLVDVQNWERSGNHRARKVETRRDRNMRRRRKQPRQQLQPVTRPEAKIIRSWVIDKAGPLSFLFEEMRSQALCTVAERRNVDAARKREAIRSLQSIMRIEVDRLNMHGCYIRWTMHGTRFEVQLREEDCRVRDDINNLAIDDWQWLLNRSAPDQRIAASLIDWNEGLSRHQMEMLLDEGIITIESETGSLKTIELIEGTIRITHTPRSTIAAA